MSGRHAAPVPEDADTDVSAPLLRVVAGSPTDEELAAVTALLAAIQSRRPTEPPRSTSTTSSAWLRSARAPRVAGVAGPGHWRGFSG